MKHEVYLIYTGDINAKTGGYIYNKRLVENLPYFGIQIFPVQLSKQQKPQDFLNNSQQILDKIPVNSVLLIDSLVFGSNPILWKKYYHSHKLIPLIHLPAFLNPEIVILDSFFKQSELELLNLSTHIIVTSPYSRYILLNEGIHPDKISVIFPGIENYNKIQQYPSVPTQFLCVANVLRNKNQLMLVQVLKQLQQFPWTLHLAGSLELDHDYTQLLRNYIETSDLHNRVILHDSVSEDVLQNLYSESHLFLFPSLFETYGMAVAEALNSGLPVFAYQSEGVKLSFTEYPIEYFDNENSLHNLLTKVLTHHGYYMQLTGSTANLNPFPHWKNVAGTFAGVIEKIQQQQ